jgi:hypothetical protein
MKESEITRLWVGRVLIGMVLFINIQSALAFFFRPATYAHWYELEGIAGDAAIRGVGVLFLMWNIPYIVALIHPQKYHISLLEAIVMQMIGLTGESFILNALPAEHAILRGSIIRFIAFDGGGLVALILAAWFARKGK